MIIGKRYILNDLGEEYIKGALKEDFKGTRVLVKSGTEVIDLDGCPIGPYVVPCYQVDNGETDPAVLYSQGCDVWAIPREGLDEK